MSSRIREAGARYYPKKFGIGSTSSTSVQLSDLTASLGVTNSTIPIPARRYVGVKPADSYKFFRLTKTGAGGKMNPQQSGRKED